MRQISMMSLSVTSLPVCIIKTSCPRTDSSYRTYCSPQENVWSSTPPSSMPNSSATFSARARWEDPEKSFIVSGRRCEKGDRRDRCCVSNRRHEFYSEGNWYDECDHRSDRIVPSEEMHR